VTDYDRNVTRPFRDSPHRSQAVQMQETLSALPRASSEKVARPELTMAAVRSPLRMHQLEGLARQLVLIQS